MKNIIISITLILLCGLSLLSCGDSPIDDNGLLITDRELCDITRFELLGPDNQTVLVSHSIDTEKATVTAVAKFGTNIKHVKPYCSVDLDAIVTPNMGEWVDFSQPRQYTVISGNREVKKTYTITVTVQGQ
ncbi:hypothetical protein D0T51_04190 [Parabacteroides sp. 52]|uniref:hypothetical protein n=1 Tax=unclassified Parabacteroides TaxID=2649774 RepID=UPI0013CF41D8|nr:MULTISPECIES: hypothetical protein [unclassified Parabacteroides]MDH6534167.1 hypothetical protein [Parabacteroides sp. PM5-20]NDV54931.1 hypothetical protein [Parabacteroides sp. 52]